MLPIHTHGRDHDDGVHAPHGHGHIHIHGHGRGRDDGAHAPHGHDHSHIHGHDRDDDAHAHVHIPGKPLPPSSHLPEIPVSP